MEENQSSEYTDDVEENSDDEKYMNVVTYV